MCHSSPNFEGVFLRAKHASIQDQPIVVHIGFDVYNGSLLVFIKRENFIINQTLAMTIEDLTSATYLRKHFFT